MRGQTCALRRFVSNKTTRFLVEQKILWSRRASLEFGPLARSCHSNLAVFEPAFQAQSLGRCFVQAVAWRTAVFCLFVRLVVKHFFTFGEWRSATSLTLCGL